MGNMNMTARQKYERLQRFNVPKGPQAPAPFDPYDGQGNKTVWNTATGELDLEAMTIKGTSTIVEKDYLRLTSVPNPATVRPEEVLHRSLRRLKNKWRKGKCDYVYACSQLKSIRQDLTVQRIRNAFTVQVYESHARMALHHGDLNELNQCQSQLRDLYLVGILQESTTKIEFIAYRILYALFALEQSSQKGTSRMEVNAILGSLQASDKEHAEVQHALAVRKAVALFDYHTFFHLLPKTPNLGGKILEALAPTFRLQALKRMCRVYKPTLSLRFVQSELELSSDNAFWNECGIVLQEGNEEYIDCKISDIVTTLEKTSLI